MRVTVGDLGSATLVEALLDPWVKWFSDSGCVIEFTLWSSSRTHAEAIALDWQTRTLASHSFYVHFYEPTGLISFAFHLPRSDSREAVHQAGRLSITEAWARAASIDPRASVAGQQFCAYRKDRFAEASDALKRLSRLYAHFKRLAFVGDLSSPPAGELDPVHEFSSPLGDNIPASERYVWQSDLSVNSIALVFFWRPDLELEREQDAMAKAIGQAWRMKVPGKYAEMPRRVCLGGEVVGSEVLSFGGPRKGGYCTASVGASQCFDLDSVRSFEINSLSSNLRWLSTFCINGGRSASAFGAPTYQWPLCNRPWVDDLIGLGLSFVSK